jgi:hypothetical protein
MGVCAGIDDDSVTGRHNRRLYATAGTISQLVIPGRREATSPESITTIVSMDSGLALRAPRNDTECVALAFGFHMAHHSRGANCVRAVPSDSPSIDWRAQGRPGVGLAHGPPATKNAGGRNHRFGQTTRPSLRDSVTAYTSSPRGPAFLPPFATTLTRCAGISTGMPGPHDFAVLSVSFVRSRTARCNTDRPSHPAPTFVTIAKRPSDRSGTATPYILSEKTK